MMKSLSLSKTLKITGKFIRLGAFRRWLSVVLKSRSFILEGVLWGE